MKRPKTRRPHSKKGYNRCRASNPLKVFSISWSVLRREGNILKGTHACSFQRTQSWSRYLCASSKTTRRPSRFGALQNMPTRTWNTLHDDAKEQINAVCTFVLPIIRVLHILLENYKTNSQNTTRRPSRFGALQNMPTRTWNTLHDDAKEQSCSRFCVGNYTCVVYSFGELLFL